MAADGGGRERGTRPPREFWKLNDIGCLDADHASPGP